VLTPGISELVKALQLRKKRVYLVSGGFRQMINPVADVLAVPHSDIYANNLLFAADGGYAGFDEKAPSPPNPNTNTLTLTLTPSPTLP